MDEQDLAVIREALRNAAINAYKKGRPGRGSIEAIIMKIWGQLASLYPEIRASLLEYAEKQELWMARQTEARHDQNPSTEHISSSQAHIGGDRLNQQKGGDVRSKPTQTRYANKAIQAGTTDIQFEQAQQQIVKLRATSQFLKFQ